MRFSDNSDKVSSATLVNGDDLEESGEAAAEEVPTEPTPEPKAK